MITARATGGARVSLMRGPIELTSMSAGEAHALSMELSEAVEDATAPVIMAELAASLHDPFAGLRARLDGVNSNTRSTT